MNNLLGVINGNTLSVVDNTTVEIQFKDGEVWYALLINDKWQYERDPECEVKQFLDKQIKHFILKSFFS